MNFFTENNKRQIRIKFLILIAFSFFFLKKFLYWFPKDVWGHGIHDWVYTDWLIDYSTGFVRRGLSGQIIDLLSGFTHPRIIIGLVAWLLFGGIVLGYMRLIFRSFGKLNPALLATLLFLPSLLPFYLYDHGAFGRKEILGFLILLWHLYNLEILQRRQLRELPVLSFYTKMLLPITLLLLTVHIFIHEASFLLFVPVHILITDSLLRSNSFLSRKKITVTLMLVYSPLLISFLIVSVLGQANYDVALSICQKWEILHALDANACGISGEVTMWSLPGSLTALPWSFTQAISLTLSISTKTILAWFFIFSLLGGYTIYISNMIVQSLSTNIPAGGPSSTFYQKNTRKYFLIPLLISVPLYLVGWDFGRWFAVISINYIMITLSQELNYIETSLFVHAKPKFTASFSFLDSSLKRNFLKHFTWLFLLLTLLFIRLPVCCNAEETMLSETFRTLISHIFTLTALFP